MLIAIAVVDRKFLCQSGYSWINNNVESATLLIIGSPMLSSIDAIDEATKLVATLAGKWDTYFDIIIVE